MTRDNVLYVVIGALVGFIAAYFMFETAVDRQPPMGQPTQAASAAGAPGAPGSGGAPTGAMAAMQQVQELRAYVEANPDDVEALRTLANMNYDISNWQRAAELYERLLALRPQDIDTMTDLGACYRNLGRPDRALELFQEVQQIQPDHWQSRFNEILVLAFDLGDLDRAAEASEALRQLQPNNPDVERLATEIARRLNG